MPMLEKGSADSSSTMRLGFWDCWDKKLFGGNLEGWVWEDYRHCRNPKVGIVPVVIEGDHNLLYTWAQIVVVVERCWGENCGDWTWSYSIVNVSLRICDNSWSAFKELDESLLRRYDVAQRISIMNFDDGNTHVFYRGGLGGRNERQERVPWEILCPNRSLLLQYQRLERDIKEGRATLWNFECWTSLKDDQVTT